MSTQLADTPKELTHEQRLVTSLLEYVFSFPLNSSERIRLVTGCLDLCQRLILTHGQDLIGKTSGEATNPGPGVVAQIVDAVARERADGYLSPSGQQFARHGLRSAGPRGLVSDGIRAIRAGLAVKNFLSAASDPNAQWFPDSTPTPRPSNPRPHGQEVASATSGEASNPGPQAKARSKPKILKSASKKSLRSTSLKSTHSRPEYTMREHPAFTAGVVVTPEPQIQAGPDGVTYVRHCQLIGNVIMPATGTAFSVLLSSAINPGLFEQASGQFSLGPWCTEISKNFEAYSIIDNAYSWRPSAAATDRGMIGMAYDYDVSDQTPSSFQSLSAYGGSSFGNVSETFTVYSDPKRAVPSNRKLLRADNNFSGDPRVFDYARLIIAGEGLNVPAGVILGTVWATYTIKFLSPHVGLTSMNLNPARCVFGTNTVQFMPTGNPGINTQLNPSVFQSSRLSGFSITSAGVITIPRGAWHIRVYVCVGQTTAGSATTAETLTFSWFQPTSITAGIQNWSGQSSPSLGDEFFEVSSQVNVSPLGRTVSTIHWNRSVIFAAPGTWHPGFNFLTTNTNTAFGQNSYQVNSTFVEFTPI